MAMTDERLPEVIDLFSGAGGLSLGFQAAGCRIRAAVDLDSIAGETFLQNFSILQPDHPPQVLAGSEHDLEQLDLETVLGPRPPEILIGGPPCQAFSLLGRGKLASLTAGGFVEDRRNRLYQKFLRAVDIGRPLVVVMENVPGMLLIEGTNYAETVLDELAGLGYRAGYALLNAAWYGVPQFRERVFFMGIRADLGKSPLAPPITHLPESLEGYRRPRRDRALLLPLDELFVLTEGELSVPSSPHTYPAVTVSQALDDLPVLLDHLQNPSAQSDSSRQAVPYPGEPHSDYARLMRSWPGFATQSSIANHWIRRTPRDYETFRRMQHGDRYPEAFQIAESLFQEELSRLDQRGEAPLPDSEAWNRLRTQYVPPYDNEIFHEKWGKLFPERPSWTVPAHLAKDSYSHIHHDSAQARMISVREAARLQSFPDAFIFCGNMGDCFRQVGNAVPPLLSWAIAASVLRVLGIDPTPPPAPRGQQAAFRSGECD
jgi:DNA (cytosine-5)-methyltransferase 1